MLDRIVATGFQDIVETDEVALDICIRILDAVAHTCLCSKVHDHIKVIFPKQAINGGLVGNIAFYKRPPVVGIRLIQLFEFLEAVFLQGHIIIVIHIVDTDDGGTLQILKQAFHQVAANESGSTRYQDGLFVQFNLFHNVHS